MNRLWYWAFLLGLVGVGFVICRLMTPTIDDPDLRDSLAVYREARLVRIARDDSLNQFIRDQAVLLTEAQLANNRLLGAAKRSEARAAVHGRRADSVLALLATARTAADSNAILLPACTERGLECAALRSANDSLHLAMAADSGAKDALRRQLAARAEMRRLDSLELDRTGRLIPRLERVARGCRLPLVDFPCPTLDLKYNLTQRAFDVGGSIPLKEWLRVGVTTQIGGKTP